MTVLYRVGGANTGGATGGSMADEFWHSIHLHSVHRLSGVPRSGADILCWSLASVRHLYVASRLFI